MGRYKTEKTLLKEEVRVLKKERAALYSFAMRLLGELPDLKRQHILRTTIIDKLVRPLDLSGE